MGCRGVGDDLDLGRGARMLQCGGVDQSSFCVLKSFILGFTPTKNSNFHIKFVRGCMSLAALGMQDMKKLTRPIKHAISSLFWGAGYMQTQDCFSMLVIGPQARLGDVEVKVLLVEL